MATPTPDRARAEQPGEVNFRLEQIEQPGVNGTTGKSATDVAMPSGTAEVTARVYGGNPQQRRRAHRMRRVAARSAPVAAAELLWTAGAPRSWWPLVCISSTRRRSSRLRRSRAGLASKKLLEPERARRARGPAARAHACFRSRASARRPRARSITSPAAWLERRRRGAHPPGCAFVPTGGRLSPSLTGDQFRALEAALRGAPARRSSAAPSCCGRALFFAAFLAGARLVEPARLPRRPDLSARRAAAHRRRADADGQPARSGRATTCCSSISRRACVGGCVLLAALSSARLRAAVRQAQLRAAAGQLRAFACCSSCSATGPAPATPRSICSDSSRWSSSASCWCFFLAGYFAQRWDVLRHARETRPSLAAPHPPLSIFRRVEYILPVLVSVGSRLVFFFLQKDMGPALVFACLFLALYGFARGSATVPVVGLALMAAGFAAGYLLGVPHTVSERVSMWLSPWDNLVHGGDQLAHSLWAFATGGATGMGIGLGDPQLVPAAHTDLILSALGEEWGFLGVAAVFALYALLVYRALRIALRAAHRLRILSGRGSGRGHRAAGAADRRRSAGRAAAFRRGHAVPELRPHLACWRTSRSWRFCSPSPRAAAAGTADRSAVPLPRAGDAAGLVLPRPARDPGQGGLRPGVAQRRRHGRGHAGGAGRWRAPLPVQSAPAGVMREIPKGTIYDRNGLPLATSNWDELEKHRAEYQQLGIDIDRACSRAETPPLSARRPDASTCWATCARAPRWGASNTSFVERDSARRLRGYDDRPTLVEVQNPATGAHGARHPLRLPRTRAAAAPPLRPAESRRAARARPRRATCACPSMRACR